MMRQLGNNSCISRLLSSRISSTRSFVVSTSVRSIQHQIESPLTISTKHNYLEDLAELIEAGKVTPMIDRTYSLEEAPQAIGYIGEGHARGKVVVTVG